MNRITSKVRETVNIWKFPAHSAIGDNAVSEDKHGVVSATVYLDNEVELTISDISGTETDGEQYTVYLNPTAAASLAAQLRLSADLIEQKVISYD